ncbi:DUF4197 family protein [Salinisphaera sp.]|uniref:DUF4197 family protein n=1 Tax=Salinisphaera sp. TaxID=1914330 RepID=UPI002D78EFE2|nr:DUF4197 family protein [Salinisphaera sp.]HET7312776.1 DUF4197 family protein [Salinisphaera sp.]
MRRIAIGLLASSLITLLTGAQASGLGTQMERALIAPSPEKISRTRRLLTEDVTAELKNVLIDGAGLAVLERGAPGGFEDRFGADTTTANDTLRQPVLARAAENTAAQAGPILREIINALYVPNRQPAIDDDSVTPATRFLRDHAAEHLRMALARIAARVLAPPGSRPATRPTISRQRLADYVAQVTVDGLLQTMARHEQATRDSGAHGSPQRARIS